MADDRGVSIYLHIPFCSARCSYCAFNTYTDRARLIPAYVEALCRELSIAARQTQGRGVKTVYFGGGTPSLLSPRQFEQLLFALRRSCAIDADAEISLEANPDDLNAPYLQDLRALGFNRLSIGMQSANAAILRLFERGHDLETVENAMRRARRAGFDNINLDLIFAAPGESLADWTTSVETALRMRPDHISMYGLELKGGTKLRQRVDAGELPPPDDDVFADMYEFASSAMTSAGYAQYEISSWRRPGKHCRHNLQYWRNLEYIGLGAGAHGFFGGCRYSTIAAPERYIAACERADDADSSGGLTPALAKAAQVSEAEDLYETIMMGLRLTEEGVNRDRFRQRFGIDIVDRFPAAVERTRSAGLLLVAPDRLRLSERGRLLSNAVIREFVSGLNLAAPASPV